MSDKEFWFETPPSRLLALLETKTHDRENAGKADEPYRPTPDEMTTMFFPERTADQ